MVALICQIWPLVAGLVGERRAELFSDELGYWRLAAAGSFNFYRPPGYPLFLSLVRRFSDSTIPVAWAQSALAVLVPLVVYWLARRLLATSRAAALIGAIGCAASFTAISLSKRVLADSLVASLGALAFAWLLCTPIGRSRGVAGASLLASLCLLLKPIFILWLPLAPTILALRGARRGLLLRRSALAVLLPLTLWLGLSWAQYQRHGQFTYSGIGRLAVIRYWTSTTVVLADHHGQWSYELFVREIVRWQAPGLFDDPTAARVSRELAAKSWSVLRQHPWRAAQALVLHSWMNLPRPFHRRELAVVPAAARNALPQALGLLSVALATLATLGWISALASRSTRWAGLALGLVWLAYLAATSLSSLEAARLMLPAEWILFLLAAAGWDRLAKAIDAERHATDRLEPELTGQPPATFIATAAPAISGSRRRAN